MKQFAFSCDQITLKLQEHLDAYALVLRGSAFFAGSSAVGRQEWKAYVDSLKVKQSIPGMQGIGFAEAIPAAQLASHIAKIRGEVMGNNGVFFRWITRAEYANLKLL